LLKLKLFSRFWTLVVIAVLLLVSCGGEKESKQNNPLDFTLNDLNGKKYTLNEQKSKVVIIDFWATWCHPCLQSIPIFNLMYSKYKDQEVLILGVGLDNEEKLRKFVKHYKIDYPVLIGNQEVAGKYGVQAIPTTCIIDKSGNLAKKHIGLAPGMQEMLEKEIQLLIKK